MSVLLKRICVWLLFSPLFLVTPSNATHLMGGELTYLYDSSSTATDWVYKVKLIVYRYCDTTMTQTAQLDQSMYLGSYPADPGNPNAPVSCLFADQLMLISSDFVVSDPLNPLCSFSSTACIQRGVYEGLIILPPDPGGYHLLVERCCRNNNIANITNPWDAGMSFYAYIPPAIINSTPQISDISVPYICIGDTVQIVNNAYDPDGDSLAYAFVLPYNGRSGGGIPIPNPTVDNNPYSLPIPNVTYATGYTLNLPFGVGSYANIDPISGLTEYYVPNQGFYVAAIEITEYRNGIPISKIRRDLQFIAIVCPQNDIPALDVIVSPDKTFTIGEGQTLCFNPTFTDPDGDSLFLTVSGPLLDPALLNPPGVINDTSGLSSVTAQFCWTPACGTKRSAPYQFTVNVADNGCPSKQTSVVYSVYVTPGPATVTPVVTAVQSPPGIFCLGSLTSFIATPTGQGLAPHYQWYVNGLPVGSDSVGYSTNQLVNGDLVHVRMTSSDPCSLGDTVLSVPVVVNMSPFSAPVASIIATPADSVCENANVQLTANVINGGAAPVYQWMVNGNATTSSGGTFSTVATASPFNAYFLVTPSTGCPAVSSDTIAITVVPVYNPAVSLTTTAPDSLCPGSSITLFAQASATGLSPYYQWYQNNTPLTITEDSLFINPVENEDSFKVTVTSDYPCLVPATAISEIRTFHLFQPVTVSIEPDSVEICEEIPLMFTLSAEGGNYKTYKYNWSAGNSRSKNNLFVPAYTGYYYGQVTDVCNYFDYDSVYVQLLPTPDAAFTYTPELPYIIEPEVQFIDHSVNTQYWHWDFGDQQTSSAVSPSHLYRQAGHYLITLTVANDYGCVDTAYKDLNILELVNIFLPNSFTPNGDSKNDVFSVAGNFTGRCQLAIYNRWGQEVYNSNGTRGGWDGTFEGTEAPAGVYTYLLKVENDPSRKLYKGQLTLVR